MFILLTNIFFPSQILPTAKFRFTELFHCSEHKVPEYSSIWDISCKAECFSSFYFTNSLLSYINVMCSNPLTSKNPTLEKPLYHEALSSSYYRVFHGLHLNHCSVRHHSYNTYILYFQFSRQAQQSISALKKRNAQHFCLHNQRMYQVPSAIGSHLLAK